jgi:hypothetical protein
MPAAGSAAGIARKWEGERRVRPGKPPVGERCLPLRVPDKHDVRFSIPPGKCPDSFFHSPIQWPIIGLRGAT